MLEVINIYIMPTKVQVSEKYFCPGWWPWQWFRRCTRLVWKWEYVFDWAKETCYGLYADCEGCEKGTRYTWGAWCFGAGSRYYAQYRHYEGIDEPLTAKGRCDSNNVGIITAPATDDTSIKKEIQVNESVKEVRSVIKDTESFIPENPICNPKGLKVTTWTVVKDYELKLEPNKVVGYMSWTIDGMSLAVSGGTLIIDNKDVYLPKKDISTKVPVKLKFSIERNKALTILNDGDDGNYSVMVELRVKLINDIEDLGILVFRKSIFFESQIINGDASYQRYSNCFARTKKFIVDFGANLVPPRPGASDPPGWGSIQVQGDQFKWIDEKVETLKKELKDISENFLLNDNIK